MAIADDYANWIVKNADKKGTPEFDTVAAAYKDALGSGSILDRPTSAMTAEQAHESALPESALGKAWVGYGGAVPRLVRGAGQRMGLISQASADEANAIDKPLLRNPYGAVGNLAGTVMAAAPTAAIGGAASLPGAALIGGGLSYLQPTSTGEDPNRNAGIGAAAGPAGIVGGRALGAGLRAGKALAEPLYDAGQQRIAGRTLAQFAEDPSKIAAGSNTPTITGAVPTLAEQTGDRGLARLEDSLRSDPTTGRAIEARLADNNAARVNGLRGLAGEDGARDFAAANRSGTAQQLYGQAFQTPLKGDPAAVADLLKAPAISDAREAAKKIAANKGTPIDDPAGSVQGLHYMKLAMDDAISTAKGKGTAAGDNLAASIKDAQSRLVGFLESSNPDYKAARVTYADMSKPVNSMDTAALVAKKGLSNGTDLSGTPTINRNALMGALKDESALTKQATGRNVGPLNAVMEPKDLELLRAIAAEADKRGAVTAAGNGSGSATAQRLATQNLLKQTLGPLGMPAEMANNTLLQTIAKPLNLLYGNIAEPKIQQHLVDAMLDPVKAQAMLTMAGPAQRSALAALFQRTAAARAAPAANALSNRP